jgi:hypothetical protein
MSWFEEWRRWLGGWHRWFGGWRRESTALVDIMITIGDDQITVDVDGERAFRCELINPAVEISIRDERGRAARRVPALTGPTGSGRGPKR